MHMTRKSRRTPRTGLWFAGITAGLMASFAPMPAASPGTDAPANGARP